SPVPGMLDDGSGFQFGITQLRVDGRDDTAEPALAQTRIVSPSYFEAMQIPLLAGELCREPLNAPVAGDTVDVMVNAAFAARYLPAGRAAGATLRANQPFALRVAGVVGDARELALNREPVPTYYGCRVAYATPALAFLVRTRGEPERLA